MQCRVFAAFLFSFLLVAAAQARANEALRWNRVMTDTSAAAETDPLTESRVFAIVQASIHDALNAIDPRYEPYRAAFAAAQGASPETAVAGAAHTALVELLVRHGARREIKDRDGKTAAELAANQATRDVLVSR